MTNDSGAKFSVDIVVNLKRAIDNLKDLQKETSEAGEYLKALNIGGKDVDIEGIFLKATEGAKTFRQQVNLVTQEFLKTGATGKAQISDLVTALGDITKLEVEGGRFNSEEASKFMSVIKTAGGEAVTVINQVAAETRVANQEQKGLSQRWVEWRAGIDAAKSSIAEVVARGETLDEAFKFLKQDIPDLQVDTGESKQKVSDLSNAFRELQKEEKLAAEEAKTVGVRIRAGLTDAGSAGEVLIANTIRAREELQRLVATGLTLKEAEIALRNTNAQLAETEKLSSKEIGSGVATLKREAKLAELETKKLAEATRDFGSAANFGDPVAAATTYRSRIEEIKTRMLALRESTNLSLNDAVVGFRKASAASGEFKSEEITAAKNELRALGQEARTTASEMSGLDQISQIFFGTTLANLAIDVLRRVLRLMGDLVNRGREVSESFFNLSVAIRGLQRLGTDITFKEVADQITRLSDRFSFFTKTEIRTGIGQILLLTRNLKFSTEQMFALSEATAALAIVTGKDFGEEGLLVARAIASGYTEALQRAGIEASRFTIQTEALKLGIDKSFNAMTQAERGLVTLGLILDQVGTIEDDVAQKSETLDGKLISMEVTVKELADVLGTELLKWLVALLDPLDRLANSFSGVESSIDSATGGAFSDILEFFQKLRRAVSITTLLSVPILLLTVAVEQLSQAFRYLTGSLPAEDLVKLEDALSDVFVTLDNFIQGKTGAEIFDDVAAVYEPFQEWARLFGDASEETADQIESDLERLAERMADIVFDYQNDLDDAFLDYQRKLEDIAIDEGREGVGTPILFDPELIDKIKDINKKEQEKLLEAQIKYEADRESAIRGSADKIAAAQAKFREKEIQAQIAFQEKQRKLREGFLFDLDDALRDRDAQQVLQLTRQFNLQNTQLQRDEQIATAERERQFQLELTQIARQREIRLRELDIEYQLKQEQIARNAQREREAAATRFEEERAEEEEKYKQRREDAKTEYERDLEDADIQYARRFEQLTANLTKEEQEFIDHGLRMIDIASTTIRAINEIYSNLLGGAGGGSSGSTYLVPGFNGSSYGLPNIINDPSLLPQNQTQNEASGAVAIGDGGVYIPPEDLENAGGYAEGGTVIARKPTVAIFGERGPEAASFTPLNRSGADVNKVFNGNLPSGGGGGSMALRVYLDEGLRADIVSQALGEVADVIVEEIRR